jgi:hypothetical protein
MVVLAEVQDESADALDMAFARFARPLSIELVYFRRDLARLASRVRELCSVLEAIITAKQQKAAVLLEYGK